MNKRFRPGLPTIGMALAVLGAGTLLGAGSDEVADFRIRIDPAGQTAEVRAEFEVERPTALNFLFREEWEGYPGLEARRTDLAVRGPQGPLPLREAAAPIGAGHRVVEVDRPQLVRLGYTQSLASPPESRYYHRASQLSPHGGHLIGGDLLPQVWRERPRSRVLPARLRLEGLPPGWSIATVAPRAGTGYRVDDVRSLVVVVGQLRTRRIGVGARTLTTAIYGDWSVDDERLTRAVERVAGGLHGIAGEAWAPGAYLYATGRVPPEVPGLSTGGQVIGRSAIVYIGGRGRRDEFAGWLHTTAHELMHWYIPEGFHFEEKAPSWFAEGFTDYFALKTLLAGDLLSAEDFLAAIGERLDRYRASPLYGRRSVTDAQADFWEDDSYRYIYDGGAAAAFLLDLGFQARGGSLERALAAIRGEKPTTVARIADALAGVPENDWIRDWLDGKTGLDWDAELGRYGLRRDGNRLVSPDGWATETLRSIRP